MGHLSEVQSFVSYDAARFLAQRLELPRHCFHCRRVRRSERAAAGVPSPPNLPRVDRDWTVPTPRLYCPAG